MGCNKLALSGPIKLMSSFEEIESGSFKASIFFSEEEREKEGRTVKLTLGGKAMGEE